MILKRKTYSREDYKEAFKVADHRRKLRGENNKKEKGFSELREDEHRGSKTVGIKQRVYEEHDRQATKKLEKLDKEYNKHYKKLPTKDYNLSYNYDSKNDSLKKFKERRKEFLNADKDVQEGFIMDDENTAIHNINVFGDRGAKVAERKHLKTTAGVGAAAGLAASLVGGKRSVSKSLLSAAGGVIAGAGIGKTSSKAVKEKGRRRGEEIAVSNKGMHDERYRGRDMADSHRANAKFYK